MRAIRCLLAAVLAAGIVTVVAAQPNFGGRGGGEDVDTLVFTNAALQEEIKITGEQKDKFKPHAEKIADLNKKRQDMFKGGFKDFDKEKFAELRKEGEKLAEDGKKLRDDVLTAAQKKRLKQIGVQVMSFQVFNDPEAKVGKGGFGGPSESAKATMKEVQTALKLTDDQKKNVKETVSAFNKERQEILKDEGVEFGKGKTPDPDKLAAANKKVDKARKAAWEKIEEGFDADQKKAWKELVGDAFDTTKLRTTQPKKD
jgi:hypothetical protein